MAGEFKIKTGLLLGAAPTQPVSYISDSSSFTDDSSSLATINAIKNYVDDNTLENILLPNDGGVVYWDDSSSLLKTDSSLIWDASNGRLGIGTNSPDQILHLKSTGTLRPTIETTSSGSYSGIDFKTNIGTLSQFLATGSTFSNQAFKSSGNYLTNSLSEIGLIAYGASGSIKFNTGGLTDAYERVRISSEGYVGIGTDSPDEILHILKNQDDNTRFIVDNQNAGTSATAQFALVTGSDSGQDAMRMVATGSNFTSLGGFVQDSGVIETGINKPGGISIMSRHTSSNIRFYTAAYDNERMRIDSSGYVGIGTTDPSSLLNIVGGSIKVTSNGDKFSFYEDDVAEADAYFKLTNGTGSTTRFSPLIWSKSNYVSSPGIWFLGDTTDDSGDVPIVQFQARQNNTTVSTRPLFSFQNYTSANTVMEILANGYVGIGTTDPSTMMQITTTDEGAQDLLSLTGDRNVGSTEIGIVFRDRNVSVSEGGYAARISSQRKGNSDDFNLVFEAGRNHILRDMMTLDGEFMYVGIATPDPSHTLDVSGNINIPNDGIIKFGGDDFIKYSSTNLSIAVGKNTVIGTEYSTVIGHSAGDNNSGLRQTTVGYATGSQNTGNYQSAVGYYAGRSNTGTFQTTIGFYSGFTNEGNYVTSVGSYSGYQNLGDNVIGIGFEAARDNSMNDVVAIGYRAGKNNSTPNQFIIKQTNINETPLIQGNFSSGYVGIGATDPSSKLHVVGAAADDVITSDIGLDFNLIDAPSGLAAEASTGSGLEIGDYYYLITYYSAIGETNPQIVSVTTTSGNQQVNLTLPVSGDHRTTGRKLYRTKVDTYQWTEYLLDTIADDSTTDYIDTTPDASLTGTTGDGYFHDNTTNKQLTIDGVKAMQVGIQNTTLGYSAGAALTSAGRSVLVGYSAGSKVTSATNNNFIGYISGNNTTSGGANCGMGYASLIYNTSGNNNTAIGHDTIFYNQIGSYNAALGSLALFGQSGNSISYNTGVGSRAGFNCIGTYNIFIGNQSGYYETGSHKLYIANSDTDRPLIYGEFDSSLLRIYGTLDLADNNITNLAIPVDPSDATNKFYVDNIITTVDASITDLYNTKLDNTTDTFTGVLTVDGSIMLYGDLYQDGSAYVIHAENIDTAADFITMREGAVVALPDGSVSGLLLTLVDGANNVIFGAGNDAIMRVGWQGDALQAIATREDTMVDGGVAFWDDSSSMLKTDSSLFWDATNKRLGIGDASPSYPLHVKGAGWVYGKIESTTSGAMLDFENQDRDFVIGSRGDAFHIRDLTASDALRFIINDEGFVGIGESNPVKALHVTVDNSAYVVPLRLDNDASGTGAYTGFEMRVGGTELFAFLGIESESQFRGVADIPVVFYTNNTRRMMISNDGNLGLGDSTITTPTTTLDIQDTTSPYMTFSSPTTVVADTLIGSYGFYSRDVTASSQGGLGGMRLYSEAIYNNARTPSYLTFYTHDDTNNDATVLGDVTERMRINSSGYVGVNASDPSSRFHVVGDATIDTSLSVDTLDAGGTRPASADHNIFSNNGMIVGDAFNYAVTTNKVDLTVGSNSGDSRFLFGQSNSVYGGMLWDYNATTSLAKLHIYQNNVGNMITLARDGFTGIGTETPLSLLHLNGGVGDLSTGLAFGDGDSGIAEVADDEFGFYFPGGMFYSFNQNEISSESNDRFLIKRNTASSTAPSYTFRGDIDTGIGRESIDQLSLISGAKEIIRLDGSINTRKVIVNPDGSVGLDTGIYFGDGDSGLYEFSDDRFFWKIGGVNSWLIDGNYISPGNEARSGIRNITPTATAPGFITSRQDLDTGLGSAGADQLSLISGGKEIIRLDGSINTRKVIINPDGSVGNDTGLWFGDGNTGIYEVADNQFYINFNGAAQWGWTSIYFGGNNTGDGLLMNEIASSTNPVHTFQADFDTGIGRESADQLSLIAGAKEIIRLDGSINTRKVIVNPDGSTGTDTGLYFGDGDTGIYENTDDSLAIKVGNSPKAYFTSTYFRGGANDYFDIEYTQGTSSTIPIYTFRGDVNTGINRESADQLSLIAGAKEIIRLDGSINKRKVIINPDGSIGSNTGIWFGDGDSGLTQWVADDQLDVILDNQRSARFRTSYFDLADNDGATMVNTAPTATTPVFVPGGTNDLNTGIGRAAPDYLSLIGGGKEIARIDGSGNTRKVIINPDGSIGSDTGLWFGDGDTGFHESSDDIIAINVKGTERFMIQNGTLKAFSNTGVRISNDTPTGTVPNIFPSNEDLSTGIGHVGALQLSLIAGGVEGLRITDSSINALNHRIINLAAPIDASDAVNKSYVDASFGDYVRKDGDTMTGDLTMQDSSIIVNDGNIVITGDLVATTKSFLIDHPTKKDKKLQYGNLEGPEHGIYDRGRLYNNDTIKLPEYWSELTREESVTVQLTSNKLQFVYVKKINKNSIKIGKIGLGKIDCFYTVYGERKDVKKLKTEK